MKKQKIEDIFSSMEDFSSIPPPELWANIEEKLDKPKKKKRAILWWSAAACLLLGLLLPSVLNFTSNSGIKNINGTDSENSKVVLDENKKEQNGTKSNAPGINKTEQKSIDSINTTLKNKKSQPNSNVYQVEETAVAHADSKNKNNSVKSDAKSNLVKTNTNQAVAEKTFVLGKPNPLNSASKNQLPNIEKRNADKVLAEKTFNQGKANTLNSFSQNQIPNSISENKTIGNSTKIASNGFNSNSNDPRTMSLEMNKKAIGETPKSNAGSSSSSTLKSEKAIADYNQKNNSKFNDVLSKKDSLQLAELQNLEKGIPDPSVKKEKEPNKISNAEKWALEVFAGVTGSENYKNEKTLGNTNDSKQGNSYGVKTKYKINKKWAVGSGFKINDLDQSVANVAYMRTNNEVFFATGDYLSINNPTLPKIASSSNYLLVSNTTKNAMKSDNIQNGNLDQSLRYIEMPLEVSYAIFSKNKASISLNTGGFVGKLISNNASLDGYSIGENVNANDFVYGSTLSSTIQYRVYKKTNLFVEPAMNYYVNPLNNQSYNQFQWGLNFGLNVSF